VHILAQFCPKKLKISLDRDGRSVIIAQSPELCPSGTAGFSKTQSIRFAPQLPLSLRAIRAPKTIGYFMRKAFESLPNLGLKRALQRGC
jgi:hypothetical protein